MYLSPPPTPSPHFPVLEKSLLDLFYLYSVGEGKEGGSGWGEGRPVSYIWLETFL